MTDFGVGTYTRNVVRALGRIDLSNEYYLIGPPAKVAEMGALPPNFHSVPLDQPDTTFSTTWPARGDVPACVGLCIFI